MVGGKVIMPAELQRFILNTAGLAVGGPPADLGFVLGLIASWQTGHLAWAGGAHDREPAPCYTTRTDDLLRVTAC
jgi:hypothetical protein